jgi:putative spermidine/putrescine transport system substrate-binding protein
MRNRLSMAALLGAAAMMLSAAAGARDLSVISWGGAYQDAQRDVYFKPFTATTKIRLTE